MMTKDLELQNLNCFCVPKPNLDTFHLQKTYIVIFKSILVIQVALVALGGDLQISLS